MSKSLRSLMWTIISLVMLAFSIWLIKDETAGTVVNLMASLIMANQFIKTFRKDASKQVRFWEIVGMVAFFVNVLLDLIMLSI